MNLLDPKSDYIFKNIFGVDDKKPLLISFLNSLLKGNPHIEAITLENTDVAKLLAVDKTTRLDVKATTDNGTIIDIEIQLKNTGEIPDRVLCYQSRTVVRSMREGQSYKSPQIISIWIMGDNVLSGDRA
ncbi:MAG: Rpn family recombination-promoting nuclease/putative transposase, partial [Holosporales bacterium]|nr:Rpn family recombination-promoting nuclease/putative transposase [Holosporales bacterium]